MILSFAIRQLLQNELGMELRHSADVERLALDIECKTKQHIGVNTMKRLLGFINDQRTPRPSTLDIIAQYLHKGSWAELAALNDDFASPQKELAEDATVRIGERFGISFDNDHQLILRYVGNRQFVVEQSSNGTILAGRKVAVAQLATAG